MDRAQEYRNRNRNLNLNNLQNKSKIVKATVDTIPSYDSNGQTILPSIILKTPTIYERLFMQSAVPVPNDNVPSRISKTGGKKTKKTNKTKTYKTKTYKTKTYKTKTYKTVRFR